MDEQSLRRVLGEEAAAEPGLQHVVCQVDSYQQQLDAKIARARHLLEEAVALGPQGSNGATLQPTLEIHPSHPSHFRQRADLWIRSDVNEGLPGAVLYYAMAPATKAKVAAGSSGIDHRAGSDQLCVAPAKAVRLNGFPVASLRANKLMDGLIEGLNRAQPGSTLRSRLYEARFLTSLRGAGPPLVTLIYHRRLDADWELAAQQLADALGCSIVGRSRGQKLVVGQDWVEEELQLRNCASSEDGSDSSSGSGSGGIDTLTPRSFYYRHVENGFSQPNAAVNEQMLDFALSCCTSSSTGCDGGYDFTQGDLLELYLPRKLYTEHLYVEFVCKYLCNIYVTRILCGVGTVATPTSRRRYRASFVACWLPSWPDLL